MSSAVARFPQGNVRGAIFGRLFELDEAASDPVRPEFRGADLEVQVGLAARLRDLAPAGADLVALAGIDPIVGSVVGHLLDRDDGQCRADVDPTSTVLNNFVDEDRINAEGVIKPHRMWC